MLLPDKYPHKNMSTTMSAPGVLQHPSDVHQLMMMMSTPSAASTNKNDDNDLLHHRQQKKLANFNNQNDHNKRQRRLLYVDALNFLGKFQMTRPQFNIHRSIRSVKAFVDSARKSGWSVHVFIDANIQTDEARNKWKKRRESEVRSGKRRVPQGCQTLLADMFKRCNVPVYFSDEMDNDDTLAFHAEADNATVLSGDHDFFRYIGSTFELYRDFEVRPPYLSLIPFSANHRTIPLKMMRPLMPPPRTTSTGSQFTRFLTHYVRGSPSPLTRILGNVHIIVRPLRQALYARLGIETPVIEEFPIWNPSTEQVVWVSDLVMPVSANEDPISHTMLMKPPNLAIAHLFPEVVVKKTQNRYTKDDENDENTPIFVTPSNSTTKIRVSVNDWYRHVFCVQVIVCELCIAAKDNTKSRQSSLLALMLSLPHPSPSKRNKTNRTDSSTINAMMHQLTLQ
jgi:hypothetical protein